MSDGIPSRPEKRKYTRLDVELPVRLEHNGKEIESTTENISCGGMFLPIFNEAVRADENLTAFISMPEGSRVVKLAAKICRVNTNLQGNVSGVAVQFSGLYDDNHLEIDRYIKWKLLN
ncbi:MAG: PilZ domain-containing protein [Deltaproteobacteria bacterium]|nr:PilZ domain-containing protein [Deltaproteobacteria bacterium]